MPIIIRKDPSKLIDKNIQTSFNVGYLYMMVFMLYVQI